MRFIIVHYHYRPGGVRRVIELGASAIVRRLREANSSVEVILAGGEAPDALWLRDFARSLAPTPVTCRIDPRAAYATDQRWKRAPSLEKLEAYLSSLAAQPGEAPAVFWAHNQGLGRNLILTEALKRAARKTGASLLLHHHDWWFDNRWNRWPEMRAAGYSNVTAVANTIFGLDPDSFHVAINQSDYGVLERYFPGRAAWFPNPSERITTAAPEVKAARQFLDRHVGSGAPVWLMPVRLLRRKNVAEALLLTRWLRPGASLALTGTASSKEEEAYAARLAEAARAHHWPLKLGLLRKEAGAPSVPALLQASEAVLLTSLQEGFGLPYLEAAAAGRPLIARLLDNMAPDLARLGFKFPQSYREILVPRSLFDWEQESRRQERLFNAWRNRIPRSQRRWAGLPPLLADSEPDAPAPFSRLTLTAQLEILSVPLTESWLRCAPLNGFLVQWRRAAARGTLRASHWPAGAGKYLSGSSYARAFCQRLQALARGPNGKPGRIDLKHAAVQAQEAFMRERLRTENLYPLVFSEVT